MRTHKLAGEYTVNKALFAATACAVVVIAAPAFASEAFVGVYAHDVTFIGNAVGLGAAGREGGADIHLGYRTNRIESLSWLGKPQVHAMLSVNTNNTSNFVAAGFDWKINLGKPGGFYLRPGMGLAYTDGKTGLPPANAPGISQAEIDRRTYLYYHRIDFGSNVLFEPELALGYDLNDSWSAELSYTHLSNGQIFHQGKNQGLDDAGVRLVYKF
jgi:lipid A 3-O-deacylase